MRVFSYSALLVGLSLLLTAPQGLGGDFKLEEGFKLIFNGKNFDGWQTSKVKQKESLQGKTESHKGRFKVVDGGIIAFDAGNAYIETVAAYAKDVHFKFDFRPGPKCNNDILFRGTKFDIIPGNKENKDVKEGEWSTFELVATGDKIEHKINGKTARTTKAAAKASEFILRAEIGKMEVKNIRAKE
ncbi:MAG: DUF1080 domain-containing protein [Planctomycetes bacterium]|nr:DUF1080 domain-containing protein [Planctomycetota bacterium]